MKKLLFIIFLMVFSFAVTANAKKPKEKVVWPKAVLTLKDGTVLNGYLRTDIHFMQKYVLFSETEEGKDVKYKNETIKSLVVKNCFGDGKETTFIPVNLYWREAKKILKTPVLAIQNYQGKHVKGYMYPTFFDDTRTSINAGVMQNTSMFSGEWWYLYNVDSDNARNISYWDYSYSRKPKSLKSRLKEMKKDFKEYPQVCETVEKQGLTAEQISENPTILLEILDKSLQ